MTALLQGLDLGSDLLNSAAELAVIGGTLLLVLCLIAFGAYAYKNVRGDGIEWPEDIEDDEGVSRGSDDDEWKYY